MMNRYTGNRKINRDNIVGCSLACIHMTLMRDSISTVHYPFPVSQLFS
jgi:hypothetical protein